MEPKFVKKQCLLSVILGTESEIFELSGPQGQTYLITDSADELLSYLRSDPKHTADIKPLN